MQSTQAAFTENHWFSLSVVEQLTHIGDQVEKAINFRKDGDTAQCHNAVQNMLHLVELTIIDPQNKGRLSEIKNIKLCLLDDFYGTNEYQSTDAWWIKYFAYFKHLAKQQKEGND